MTVLIKTESSVKKQVWVADGSINRRPPTVDGYDGLGKVPLGDLDVHLTSFVPVGADPQRIGTSSAKADTPRPTRPTGPNTSGGDNNDSNTLIVVNIPSVGTFVCTSGIYGGWRQIT